MHLSKRVADNSGGTSLSRISISTKTVMFPSRMGTSLTSFVHATPPTPFACTGMDVVSIGMTILFIPHLFSSVSIRSKYTLQQVGCPAPVSTSALPAGSRIFETEAKVWAPVQQAKLSHLGSTGNVTHDIEAALTSFTLDGFAVHHLRRSIT